MIRIGAQKIPGSTLVLLLSDAMSVVLGLLAAITLRLVHRDAIVYYLNGPPIVARFVLVCILFGIPLHYSDLYHLPNFSNRLETFMRLLQALGSACLVLAIIYYFAESISLGRGIAVMSGPAVFLLMLGSRAAL